MSDKNEFKKRIGLAIIASGKSQRQIALAIDVTPQALGKWLKSGNVSRDKLVAFSNETNVDFEWLSLGPSASEQKKRILGYNLRTARISKNLSIEEAAKSTGKDVKDYIDYEIGETIPTADQLMEISSCLNIPLGALIKKQNHNAAPESQELSPTAPNLKALFSKGARIGEQSVRDMSYRVKKALNDPDYTEDDVAQPIDGYNLDHFINIPYYRDTKLAAGAGTQVYDEETDSSLTFQSAWVKSMGLRPEALCVVRCKGDSMEPRIHDGDVVLIDTSRKSVEDSMVYAINYGGEAKLKRMIKKFDGSLVLRSDNQRYEDEVIPPTDDHASQLHVIGKAVWIGGML